MKNKCNKCSIEFEVSTSDAEFCEKISVPVPKLCPDCRQQRRAAYRNEWGLHRRKCDKCGDSMIAMFSSDKYTVYCDKCWWADDFDPRDYGQEFDFSRPFFEQMDELLKRVPLPRLVIGDCENSEYTNYAWKLKNCYLVSASDYCEDCLYCAYTFRSKDCMDCLFVNDCELLYQGIDCKKCYEGAFLQNCQGLTDCYFCFDCRGCQNCLGCVGLRKKKYHIFNKKYSREEYEKKKNEFFGENRDLNILRDEFKKFRLEFPHKFAEIESCENCSGDHLSSCKNCNDAFDLVECEDCNHCALGIGARDCQDCTGTTPSELCYESVGIPENYFLKFCAVVWPKSSYLEYCFMSRASDYCFGGVSLLKNKYCILNKQYSREEYEKLVPRIIEHMKKTPHTEGQAGEYGEFFPISISPFNYNDTLAQDYFPIEKSEALKNGWRWFDEEEEVDGVVGDDVLICEVTGKPYRLVEKEVRFYERLGFEGPRRSPLQRHRDRMKLRGPRKVFERKCSDCGVKILTSYADGEIEKLYCKDCYLKEVV